MAETISILPKEISISELHGYLLGAIGPRPIAFASTIDPHGRPNLAPFSFFNVFGSNPPILIFSPSRRVRDNTTKHTLKNILNTKEVVINIVNHAMVQQTSLASTEYAEGVNEFEKSGLNMLPSDLAKPFRVAESPVQFECKVTKVEPLGNEGGAGNLIFSEVLKLHVTASVLDKNGAIDPYKIDQVARMGGNWYCRANQGLFEVPKPLSTVGIGVDKIPENIRHSSILTGNDLGLLGNVEKIPNAQEIADFLASHSEIWRIIGRAGEEETHKMAQEYIKKKEVRSAWKILLAQ